MKIRDCLYLFMSEMNMSMCVHICYLIITHFILKQLLIYVFYYQYVYPMQMAHVLKLKVKCSPQCQYVADPCSKM